MGNFSIIKAFENFASLGAEWVMWLMLILGLIMLILAFERAFLFLTTRINTPQTAKKLVLLLNEGKVKEAQQELTQGKSMEQRVLADALEVYDRGPLFVEQIMMSAMAREKQRYNQFLNYFGTIGNNTPFIGLFGTVIGIILAFKELGNNPKGGLEVIGPLISEALVATAVGLFVAIPSVVIFNYFKAVIKDRVANTDFLMRIVLAHVNSQQVTPVQTVKKQVVTTPSTPKEQEPSVGLKN